MSKKSINQETRSVIRKEPENFGSLGRRIEIGSKSNISKNKPGMEVKFHTPTIDVLIGIGKDHVAHLIMDEDAWAALKKGQKIHVTTVQEFKEKFL